MPTIAGESGQCSRLVNNGVKKTPLIHTFTLQKTALIGDTEKFALADGRG
ncbi:hypothetical protein [Desulfuromonas acetoxidans]|nr:hypothetical protein [Desulfuromonas acetoxidans]NVD24024.1 hypothetical protein [Desulfuromonas acetoxidans]